MSADGERDSRRQVAALAVLLTVVAGATNALSFLRLGQVFTSVMTGNLVLLGVAVGTGDGSRALHAALALAGYLVGVSVGVRLAAAGGAAQPPEERDDDDTGGRPWPGSVTVAIGLELIPLVGLLVGWDVVGGHPHGWQRLALLVPAALAMGLQGAAVREVQVPGLSTTYFTSTLTRVIARLVLPGRPTDQLGVGELVALAAGACGGALLTRYAAAFAPVLPVAGVGFAVLWAAAKFGASR